MSPNCNVCDRISTAIFFSDSSACGLWKKIDVLLGFVTANIGILSPFSPTTDQTKSYAAVADSKQVAVSLPRRVIQGELPFILIRNGWWRTSNKSFLPITSYSSFKILTKDEEEDHGQKLIG